MKYELRLYIAGETAVSKEAVANITRICEDEIPGRYSLMIVDILERPGVAEKARILATPTLVRESPPPLHRVVGDLSDRKKVITGLDLGS